MSAKRRLILDFLKAADLLVVAVAFCISALVTASGLEIRNWYSALATRVALGNVLFVLAYLLLWHMILVAYGLYRSYRISAASREWHDLGLATVTAVCALIPAAAVLQFQYVTPAFLCLFGISAFIALATERRLLRALARRIRIYGHNLRNVVIVGDGASAMDLCADFTKRSDFGYHVWAVVDVNTPMLGGREHEQVVARVRQLIDNNPIDEVFVTLPLGTASALIGQLVAVCEEQGTTVRVVARIADLDWGRADVDEVNGTPVLTISSGPRETIGLVAKRLIDVLGATLGLIVFAPLFVVVAVAIKLDSPGPVFFIQERVGHNRKRFRTFKFRTMVADAPSMQESLEHLNEARGPIFKIRNDPRVTRVGRWLRRTSIDELPQLINVVRGEMSLVGPRPLPVRDVEHINTRWHKRRFSVKPGMTGMWQANGRSLDFDEWIKEDMHYIDNWSLTLDMKILLKTVPAVMSRTGAH